MRAHIYGCENIWEGISFYRVEVNTKNEKNWAKVDESIDWRTYQSIGWTKNNWLISLKRQAKIYIYFLSLRCCPNC